MTKNLGWATRRQMGFTFVELLIIIVALAILASIAVVSYRGYQRHAAQTRIEDTLNKAKQALIAEKFMSNALPSTLPSSLQVPSDVNLEYIPLTGPHYSNLSAVQNGVLFYNICANLVNENRPDVPALKYGQGYQVNWQGNIVGTVNYLWGPSTCNVYNHDKIEFNSSWGSAGAKLGVPVSAERVTAEATKTRTGYSATDFPDYNQVVNQFYQTVHSRFLASGGTYPITTFWDPWATLGGSGVYKQELPAPDQQSSQSYCLTASSSRYGDIVYSISSNNPVATEGACS